jgi:cytochrome c oxidase cbb3-type subunit 2
MKVLSLVGVPYSAAMIANAAADIKAQATGDDAGAKGLADRYKKVNARDFDGNPAKITEADALIAYLQVIGTLVDFKLYDDKANVR